MKWRHVQCLMLLATAGTLPGCLASIDDEEYVEPSPIFVQGTLSINVGSETVSVLSNLTYRNPHGDYWEPMWDGPLMGVASMLGDGPIFLFHRVDDTLQPAWSREPIDLWNPDSDSYKWDATRYEVASRTSTGVSLVATEPADAFTPAEIRYEWRTAGTPTLRELAVEWTLGEGNDPRAAWTLAWQPKSLWAEGTVIPNPFFPGTGGGGAFIGTNLAGDPEQHGAQATEPNLRVALAATFSCQTAGSWPLNDGVRSNPFLHITAESRWLEIGANECRHGSQFLGQAHGCTGSATEISYVLGGDPETFEDLRLYATLVIAPLRLDPITWDGTGWVETADCQ